MAELRALMKPVQPSFFSLGREFTKLRRHTAWLSDASFAPVGYTLEQRAFAWQRYSGEREAAPASGYVILAWRKGFPRLQTIDALLHAVSRVT
ncbi:MAG: hypothetical protein F4Y85_12420 [Gammaproteobacteria bacterium]|nr:hypothetical protein [Gammaproteobacteria bacterium]